MKKHRSDFGAGAVRADGGRKLKVESEYFTFHQVKSNRKDDRIVIIKIILYPFFIPCPYMMCYAEIVAC